MRNLLKAAAIFFSCVILLISVITENYCFSRNSKLLLSDAENLSSDLPVENTYFFLLNRYGESLVISPKNQPVFNVRNQTFDTYSDIFKADAGKLKACYEYLSNSGTILPNLKNIDIIFPFHYFW